MTEPVTFHARCTDCGIEVATSDYEERAHWAGTHRISTGHNIHYWIGATT